MESKPTKKIRKGDLVLVTTGNDRGQTGIVKGRKGDLVVVQGLNLRKKHVKRNEQARTGGIVEFEKPIHASNLRVCSGDDKTPVKLKVRQDAQGDRQFVYQQGDQEVVYRSVKHPK